MPAGCGKQCNICYWKALLTKRIDVNRAAFSHPEMADQMQKFSQWLGDQVGPNKAAISLKRYVPFFLEMEKTWSSNLPKAEELLEHFGTIRLRKVLLIGQWLESEGISLSREQKYDAADQRRIREKLSVFDEDSPEGKILQGYYQHMAGKTNTSVRSIRLALTPAIALLQLAREESLFPPDQSILNCYLSGKPGQRAAISGFVRHLRDHHGVEIELPSVTAVGAKRAQRKKLEQEMLEMMRQARDGEIPFRRWISITLAYFHGLPVCVGAKVKDTDIRKDREGWAIVWEGGRFWVPRYSSFY
ncbi:hypothetical protein [Ectothiorhodospira shaposhnikovii]|uniref:hypothetical protein n=1 Tax=Ectothiorhodospira shaposhnikovii TaxID=1054 RepID=UPI001EE903EB|nr:hypothetical protein [Ectothiorhodospira shaposhnikovii]MCG5512346.1 hypothetical protein [Ectothiorhodospira shaposhnikovii]